MNRFCPGGDPENALAPYRALLEQVDRLCTRIVTDYRSQITCHSGCSSCCILQAVLPVEAASLALAWRQLPEAAAQALRVRLQNPADSEQCPLLSDKRCPLYSARPIICRTHGLPLLVEETQGRRVDRCPLNFTGLDTLPGTAIIDLERLNDALIIANRHFLATCFPDGGLPERIPLRKFLDFPSLPDQTCRLPIDRYNEGRISEK